MYCIKILSIMFLFPLRTVQKLKITNLSTRYHAILLNIQMIKNSSLSNCKSETSGIKPIALSVSRCDLLWKQQRKDRETTQSRKSFKKHMKYPAVACLILRTLHTISVRVNKKSFLTAHFVIRVAAKMQTHLRGWELTPVIFLGCLARQGPTAHRPLGLPQELSHMLQDSSRACCHISRSGQTLV